MSEKRTALQLCAASVLALVCACQPPPAPAPDDAGDNAHALKVAPDAGPEQVPSDSGSAAPEASVDRSFTEEELALFDRIVADEILFPRAADRARYERQEPETIKEQRHIGFELKRQPGMKKNRHFHLIDVAFARPGTYVSARRVTKLNGTAGPNGSSIEFATQTPDGAYDIRVSQGMLLVRPVKAPEFDLERVALALVKRYASLRKE